jgi:hypothetical protein
LPLQFGVQMQEVPWHVLGETQLPQLPPQPSSPHSLPPQFGEHWQTPLLQLCPPEQLPQLPPQPLGPQFLPALFGAQQVPVLRQVCPVGHAQSNAQLLQFSPVSHFVLPQ